MLLFSFGILAGFLLRINLSCIMRGGLCEFILLLRMKDSWIFDVLSEKNWDDNWCRAQWRRWLFCPNCCSRSRFASFRWFSVACIYVKFWWLELQGLVVLVWVFDVWLDVVCIWCEFHKKYSCRKHPDDMLLHFCSLIDIQVLVSYLLCCVLELNGMG